MTDFIVLPGIGGSGEQHWQTLWQRNEPNMRRFEPTSWDEPQLDDWIEALNSAVRSVKSPPILVAHSLACLLVAHWSGSSDLPVAGAFLVSIPDPQGPAFPKAEAASFMAALPASRLRFPSMIVASSDDPYGTLSYQRGRAEQWGSQIAEIGERGHINASSGVGEWAEGRRLLQDFASQARVA